MRKDVGQGANFSAKSRSETVFRENAAEKKLKDFNAEYRTHLSYLIKI